MKEQENLTGKGITAAVLDTGIFPHMDFDGRIVAFRDLVYGRETPYDDNGHGTHVCGILGGSGRASGGKYQGAAPGCRFVVVKILDRRGNGRKQDILAAIDWVCKERIRLNIRILNISVGTTEQEKTVDDLLVQAVERAWDDGITVVTAAGNLGPAPGSITAPGQQKSDHRGSGRSAGAKKRNLRMRPDTGLRLQTGSCRAWKTSHFLRAWKKQEGICGEERHLDGGTAGVRSRGFGT